MNEIDAFQFTIQLNCIFVWLGIARQLKYIELN